MPKKQAQSLVAHDSDHAKLIIWEDVNLALKTLGERTVCKRELENRITEEVNAITAKYQAQTAAVIADIDAITSDIEKYVIEHKDEFAENRSKDFSYGSISCRVSKAVRIISKSVCLKALKALAMTEYIIVKEDPNKEMLKTLSDIELAKVACEFKVTDNISIEPYIEDLTPNLP
ncbi:MAG: host-nuclease inhibitor Gam family protein [Candidatus Cloacimonadaceae bacterium]|nr:host-nuclease inhibitor Gam family protein [Candidatus Cloacimonadaceae bacterium]